jgi:hypothetical protein
MENRIIKTLVLLVLITNTFAQKTKLDTIKMFEGHWVFKMAMNADYTTHELEETYLKNTRGGKIHIIGNKIYGNFDTQLYENFELNFKEMPTNGGINFLDNEFEKKDLVQLKKMGIGVQSWIGFYQTPYEPISLPYFSIQLLIKQKYLLVGMDQTMFFLEKDKSEYKFIGVKEAPIYRVDKSLTINKVLENEEVEVLEKGDEYTKIRYWGKALIIGWVKTNNLKMESNDPEYWNIYKNNIIQFQIQNPKSIIYNENHQKTNKYLIKGDTVEVLEEQNYFLKIKFKNIEGFIPRIDVEGYNTFRITKTKAIIHLAPNKPTKMYVLKGDDVELIDSQNDWLKIRFKGKKTIEGWIKKSDVE